MFSVVLGVAATVCAIGWFFSRLSTKIIICYMIEKGYMPPTDEELKTCSQKVIKRTFTFGRKNKR